MGVVTLKGGSPGGLGGVPAGPGLRRVPGLPGFPALGASGRVAAAPPSPSERSAAAGPNHRSHPGGGGALPLAAPAQVPAGSGPRSRTAEVRGSRTVLRSARPSLGHRDCGLRGPPAEAHPLLPARWHSLASVGRRDSRGRGGPRLRDRPLSPAEGEPSRPPEERGGGAALGAGGAGPGGGARPLAHQRRARSFPPHPKLASAARWAGWRLMSL